MHYQQLFENSFLHFAPREGTIPFLSQKFLNRYTNIPETYLIFLQKCKMLSNQDHNVWFISIEDYNGTSDSAFAWNEFEQLSLEAAEGSLTPQNDKTEIRAFWDYCLPIAFSVKATYQYLALDLHPDNYGQIVLGNEVEFEKVVPVCQDIMTLFELLAQAELPEEHPIYPFFSPEEPLSNQ